MKGVRIKKRNGEKVFIPHTPIDMVGVHERAASFTKRSIKSQPKLDALYWALSMTDLTTLEGADTPEKVRQLCAKAIRPVSPLVEEKYLKDFKPIPQVAAVCVYPNMVRYAKEFLGPKSKVEIAAVATAFPSGQFPLDMKLKDVDRTIKMGATEIDMVISRGEFLRGKYQYVYDEIEKVAEICQGRARLKVIFETGELKTYENVRLASWLAMEAGADFIKTSTGKISPAATLPVSLVMLQAIDDYYEQTGKMIGMKPAGGIRTAKDAIQYLVMVNEVLGEKWLDSRYFRFGASSLVDDLLKEILTHITGQDFSTDYFSL